MLVLLLLLLALFGVSSAGGGEGAAVESPSRAIPPAAAEFDAYPLYWVGDRFERWKLTTVDFDAPGFVTFVYGTCTPAGDDGGCSPPLQIQVSSLCSHLDVVARTPIWRRRTVRGAPVGTIDGAPVLFTSGAQVKVYRGEGADPGLPWRILQELRSANGVEPVIGSSGPIPGPAPGVLAGTRPCST